MNLTRKALCILISGAALGAATPAFADRDRDFDRGHRWDRHERQRVVVVPRHHRHAPPPRVVYVEQPVYVPAPVVYEPPPVYAPDADLGAVLGAIIGSAIGKRM